MQSYSFADGNSSAHITLAVLQPVLLQLLWSGLQHTVKKYGVSGREHLQILSGY